MTVNLLPAKLSGILSAPPSKSMSHRALICAALTSGRSRIDNLLFSEDILATIHALTALGASFIFEENAVTVEGISLPPSRAVLNCGESGSTLRFLIPIACALGVKTEFRGKGKLPSRPITPYITELSKNGIHFDYPQTMPFSVSGTLRAGKYCIAGNISSQFITGLLFALPLLNGDSEIRIKGTLESRPYVDMTIAILHRFGIQVIESGNRFFVRGNQRFTPCDYRVEGDYSQAAFFLVAATIGNTELLCDGLSPDSIQGDKQILGLLKQCGADVFFIGERIRIFADSLKPFRADARNIPDLVPILAVLACYCKGTSKIRNAARLRMKESDRILSATSLVNNLGGNAVVHEDTIEITGSGGLRGGKADSFNDHRIAMAAAIAATCANQPVTLTTAESVKKSYPMFYEDFKRLGGKMDVIDLD